MSCWTSWRLHRTGPGVSDQIHGDRPSQTRQARGLHASIAATLVTLMTMRRRRRLAWWLAGSGALVAVLGGTWWLLSEGTRGAEVANILALPVAVLGVLIAGAGALFGQHGPQPARQTSAESPPHGGKVAPPRLSGPRAQFHRSMEQLSTRPFVSTDAWEEAKAQAERDGFAVTSPIKRNYSRWSTSSLPRKSNQEQFVGYLLYCGVPVGELPRWVSMLDRAREDLPSGRTTENDPEESEPGTSGGRRGRSWRATTPWIVAAFAAVAVLGGGATWLLTRTSATPPAPPRPPSERDQPFFSENFDSDQLDSTKWVTPSDPAHLYPRDRVLNMIGATEPGRGTNTDLAPRVPQSFREIDFVFGVPDYQNPGPGGGKLVVTEQSGRTHEVVFGPSRGNVPLAAAVLICTRPTCTTYDDYVPPRPPTSAERFVLGEAVPMKVIQTGSTLTFWMRDVMIGQAQVSAPLASFRFNAYAVPDERWHITVDAVRVYR